MTLDFLGKCCHGGNDSQIWLFWEFSEKFKLQKGNHLKLFSHLYISLYSSLSLENSLALEVLGRRKRIFAYLNFFLETISFSGLN